MTTEKKNVQDNETSKKRYNNLNMILAMIVTIQVVSFLLIIVIAGKSTIQINNVIITSFNETLSTIQKNCGSVYITHRYGSNDWFVFKSVCLKDGYCKYDYVPLGECLRP